MKENVSGCFFEHCILGTGAVGG